MAQPKSEVRSQADRISDFRSNQVRQAALLQLLSENENLIAALAICSKEADLPAIPLDAPEIVSVRAAALARGSKRVLDVLYLMATPPSVQPDLPDPTYGAEPEEETTTSE